VVKNEWSHNSTPLYAFMARTGTSYHSRFPYDKLKVGQILLWGGKSYGREGKGL